VCAATLRASITRQSPERWRGGVARSKRPTRRTGAAHGASISPCNSVAGGGDGAFVVAAAPLSAHPRATLMFPPVWDGTPNVQLTNRSRQHSTSARDPSQHPTHPLAAGASSISEVSAPAIIRPREPHTPGARLCPPPPPEVQES
jgi:hypothetical protein